jgi:hypothetical protein
VSRAARTHRPSPPPARRPAAREPERTDAAGARVEGWSLASVPVSRPSGPEPAPPVVHDVLDSPGEPLDPQTRVSMESRFGYDFRSVRVHSDGRAGASAAAVGAAAYAAGDHIAFAPGLYAPQSAAGRELLAHELAHVAEAEPAAGPLTVGRHDDVAERRAVSRAADRAPARPHGRPERRPAAPRRGGVVRRTLLGTLLGAGAGLVGGALLGGLVGGPIGALIGGAVGLIGGAIAGEMATTRSRPLTPEEIRYAREIYLDSVDYTKIRITRDSVLSTGAPRTIGNTIHLRSDWGHFERDTLDLTEQGRLTLIHEMGHVWQYQNGGLAYIPQSIIAQLGAVFSGGDRNRAYDWRAAYNARLPWARWNPEQQAEAIEDYNRLLRKQKDGTATTEDIHTLSILLPFIEMVRRGEGAPTFFGPTPGRPGAPASSSPPAGGTPSGGATP